MAPKVEQGARLKMATESMDREGSTGGADYQQRYEDLLTKYNALEAKYDALRKKEEKDVLPWLPYVKMTVLWTITSLILFILAERQFDDEVFGFLVAIAGASIFLTIPITHYIGHNLLEGYKLFQPFQGGIRFVVLQGLSWTFYSVCACIVLASVAYAELMKKNGLLASAGVIGILAQVFMVSSLLTFAPSDGRSSKRNEKKKQQAAAIVPEFVKMNSALIMIGAVLALFSDYTSKPILATLILVCCICAIFLTYGIGGYLANHDEDWAFVQLFRGGSEFVTMQIMGWSFFGIMIIGQGLFIVSSLYFYQMMPSSMYIGVFAAVISQIIIAKSISKFQSRRKPKEEEEVNPFNYRKLEDLTWLEYLAVMSFLTLLCNTQFVFFVANMLLLCLPYVVPISWRGDVAYYTYDLVPHLKGEKDDFYETFYCWWSCFCAIAFWSLFYSVLKTQNVRGWRLSLLLALFAVAAYGGVLTTHHQSVHHRMLVVIVCFNLVYVSTTYTKLPENNCNREWPELKELNPFFPLAEKFFGIRFHLTPEAQKIAHKLGNADAEKKYQQVIMLAHPHGIFPLAGLCTTMYPTFKKLFPHFAVSPCTASVTHCVPVMRDLLQYHSVCDVSKTSVRNLIRQDRSIQIFLGGQSECFMSKSWEKEIYLVRRMGIFKIAIQEGLGLLPLFTFGEMQLFDNVYMPKMQAFCKKHFGFPIPFVLLGQYYLPIARRAPVSFAIDEPVFPVQQKAEPTIEEIKELRDRYFDKLEKLFERYKKENGHEHHKIIYVDK